MIFGLFEEHGPITAFQLSSDRSFEAGEQQWALSIWNKQIIHSGWVVKIPNWSPVRTFCGGEEANRVWSKQFERSCEHSGPVRAFKLSGEGWQRPQRTLPSCPHNHNPLKCGDLVHTSPRSWVHKWRKGIWNINTIDPNQVGRLAGQTELLLLVLTKHPTKLCNPFSWVSETLITGVKMDESWRKPIPKLNIFRRAHLIFTPCLHLDWWSNRF